MKKKGEGPRDIEFSANGAPIGENANDFSTSIAYIVKETVPITYRSWQAAKKSDPNFTENLWERLKVNLFSLYAFSFIFRQLNK